MTKGQHPAGATNPPRLTFRGPIRYWSRLGSWVCRNAAVAAVWPELPDVIKAGIVAIVKGASK